MSAGWQRPGGLSFPRKKVKENETWTIRNRTHTATGIDEHTYRTLKRDLANCTEQTMPCQ